MLSLRLFGDLAIEADGRPRPLPDRRPGRLLLGWLALRPGVHARGDVAAALWPDVRPDSARTSLRSALAATRRSLGDGDHLVVTRSGIGLADDVAVDAARFRALAERGDPEGALALYRGPLLQGLDEEWVQQARDEFAALAADALGAAADRAAEAGDHARAVDLARRRLALDDLSEPAARDLIRRLADAGDRAGALAAYGAVAERLSERLRLAPSRQTRRLAASVRAGVTPARATPQLGLPVPLPGDALVGRGAELAALRDDATVGIVCGEAGIGKSRLLAAIAADAHAAGAQVLAGRCRPAPELPYAPLAEALRAALEQVDAGAPGAALSPLLPELAPPGAPADGEPETARLYAAVVAALRAIAGERRPVLLVDDLHWADPSTLRMLDHLLVALPGLRLVVAHRPGLDERAAAVLDRWARTPGAARLALAGLDEPASRALLEAAAGRPAPAGVARALHARTAGHPLFLRELAARWAGGWPAADAVAAVALPERVAGVLAERAAALSPDARRTLAVGAALGESFSFATLCAVADRGDEDATLDALDEAVAAALLREERAGRYAFAHGLAREAILGALTETRRAHLHRRVAAALEARGADVRRVAEHHLLAGELGEPGKAAEFAARAAARATGRHAHEDAAALYERALAAPGTPAPRRGRLALELGRARRRAGEGAAAREAFATAGDLARALGDAELLAEAALGLCAIPFFPGGEPADDLAVGLLGEALALTGGSLSPLTVRVRAQLAREGYFTHGAPVALAAAEAALAQARELDDDEALAAALDALSPALVGQAAIVRRREVAEETLRVADRLGARELGLRARIWRVLAAMQAGEWAAAEPEEAALEEAAERLRQPAWRWWPALWQGARALRDGRLEEGERLAAAAWELGERALGERAALELQAQLFWIRREQGRLDELDDAAASLSDRYSAIPAWRCVRALVDAELGRHDAARAALDALAPGGFAALRDANRLVSLTLAADVCRLIAAGDLVPVLRAELEPHAGEWPVSGYGGLVLRPVEATLAQLA